MTLNPATDNLVIDLKMSKRENFKIEVSNSLGQILFSIERENDFFKEQLDLNGFREGIYFLSVVGKDWRNTKKLLIN